MRTQVGRACSSNDEHDGPQCPTSRVGAGRTNLGGVKLRDARFILLQG